MDLEGHWSMALKKGEGGIWLLLTSEQYEKLKKP
jgi:hypothetical protein